MGSHWLKVYVALHGKPISKIRDVTCHMGSQCYLPPDTSERAPPEHRPVSWYSIYVPHRDGRLHWLRKHCLYLYCLVHVQVQQGLGLPNETCRFWRTFTLLWQKIMLSEYFVQLIIWTCSLSISGCLHLETIYMPSILGWTHKLISHYTGINITCHPLCMDCAGDLAVWGLIGSGERGWKG